MKVEFGHKRHIVEAVLAKRKIRSFRGGGVPVSEHSPFLQHMRSNAPSGNEKKKERRIMQSLLKIKHFLVPIAILVVNGVLVRVIFLFFFLNFFCDKLCNC